MTQTHYYYTYPLGALGALHAVELLFLFGNFSETFPPSDADLAVSETMQHAWTTFARDGSPELAPGWPAYDPTDPAFAVIDEPASSGTELRAGRCESFRTLGLVP